MTTNNLIVNWQKFINDTYSWHCLTDYESERTYCSGDCDDYCRCTSISNVKINSISADSLFKSLSCGIEDEFVLYSLDRIIQKSSVLQTDNWEAVTTSGWYGEEIDRIKCADDTITKLEVQIKKLASASSNFEMIKIALEAEYAYLLQSLIDNEYEVSIIEVESNKISLGNDDYMVKIGSKHVDFMPEYSLPRAVCFDQGSRYRLIDGYHRTTAALQNKMKKIKIVCLTKI